MQSIDEKKAASEANDYQVGGSHYSGEYQHWDFVQEAGLGYLLGNATKYIARHRRKGGAQDLAKAGHYIRKWMEGLHRHKRQFEGRDIVPIPGAIGDGGEGAERLSLARIFAERNELTVSERSCIVVLTGASFASVEEGEQMARLALEVLEEMEAGARLSRAEPLIGSAPTVGDTSGLRAVIDERRLQLAQGKTPASDRDRYNGNPDELARAGAALALADRKLFPWTRDEFEQYGGKGLVKRLTIAAALLCAAVDVAKMNEKTGS